MATKKQVKLMRCTVSHEKPLPGGGWATFEAGKTYPLSLVPGGSPYFAPVVDEPRSEEGLNDGNHEEG